MVWQVRDTWFLFVLPVLKTNSWQDFCFACAVYPANAEFIASVQAEAIANVKRLRRFACIVLFCGNNEGRRRFAPRRLTLLNLQVTGGLCVDYQQILQWNIVPQVLPAQVIYEQVLPGIVREHTQVSVYLSLWLSALTRGLIEQPNLHYPFLGIIGREARIKYQGTGEFTSTADRTKRNELNSRRCSWKTDDPTQGDVHRWEVWAGTRPWQDYDLLKGRLVSEFGMPSAPDIRTIDWWLEGGTSERYIDSKMMTQHNRAGSHVKRFAVHMLELFRMTGDFET
jgi:beta-mannosidase